MVWGKKEYRWTHAYTVILVNQPYFCSSPRSVEFQKASFGDNGGRSLQAMHRSSHPTMSERSTRKKRYRQNNYSVLNSRLNRSRSCASQASQRSSVRPSKATVILIVVQMLSDMIAFCPASGPRLFRCKFSAVTKCSIASLQVTEHYNACQQQRTQHHIYSVTTNLEYSGISLNTENSWNS